MDKKQFVVLLYAFGVVPMLYTLSNTRAPALGWIGFGLLNIAVLVLFALVFTPNQTPPIQRKKKITMIVVGGLLLIGMLIGGLTHMTQKASIRLHTTVFAPNSGSVVNDRTETGSGSTGDIVAIDLLTGDIDIDALVSGQQEKPDYPTMPVVTGTAPVDTFQKPDPTISTPVAKPVAEDKTISSVLPAKGILNYAQVVPYLVSKYNLKNNGKTTKFTNVTATSALYSSFNIAANKGMIGVGVNPASKMSCNTYLVLKGIAAGWKVEYKSGDPFGPYRVVADKKGETNGCLAGAFVTKATL